MCQSLPATDNSKIYPDTDLSQTDDKVRLVYEMPKSGATLKPNDSKAGVRFGRVVFSEFSIYAGYS